MQFKQFKPQNKLPIGFTATGQIDKMKEFISKLATENAKDTKVANLLQWLQTFDTKAMDQQTIDELVGLAEIAEDKQKIALIDLLRLVVLEPKQAEYVFERHWSLVDVCVMGYVSCLDLKDKDAKVTHNYHLACFKFLMNAYQTAEGRR